jgi:hypothetical protein
MNSIGYGLVFAGGLFLGTEIVCAQTALPPEAIEQFQHAIGNRVFLD